MLFFFMQVWDSIYTHKIYIFEIFVLYAWIVYFTKWYYARKYKPFKYPYTETVSVIVPVLNEDTILFKKALRSIKNQHPQEFFVVLDKFENNPIIRTIAKKYATVIKAKNEGKREAVAEGVRASKSDIIIIADSDTVFARHSIKELVKPFADFKVGGVTTRQKIINQKGNVIRIIAGWMEDVRFAVGNIPSQSVHGCIGCLPGRAIAFRRDIILSILDDFLNQSWLGKKLNSGDDRVLTSLVLKKGYKTVYQSTALVYTDCPNNFSKFIRQQLRWARSSQRETVLSLGWIFRKPFTAFVFITDIITPLFFAVVIADSSYRYLIGQPYFNIPLAASIIMGIVGMNITIGLKQGFYMDLHWKDIIYVPVYVTFLTFVMTPIRIFGFLTMFNSSWMTRKTELAVTG